VAAFVVMVGIGNDVRVGREIIMVVVVVVVMISSLGGGLYISASRVSNACYIYVCVSLPLLIMTGYHSDIFVHFADDGGERRPS